MAQKPLTRRQCKQAVTALRRYGELRAAARHLGIRESTFKNRLNVAIQYGLYDGTPPKSNELSDGDLREAVNALERYGTQAAAAIALKLTRTTYQSRLSEARRIGIVPDTIEPAANLTLPESSIYVITSAQNATPIHKRFWRSLQHYCKHRNARLVVIPTRYRNPTSRWTSKHEDDEWWAEEMVPHLYAVRTDLNDSLRLLADIKVQPTAVNPLASFGSISGLSSGIIGHPKLALTTIATHPHRLPKVMCTTGAVTVKNYTDTRTGKAGEFHHTFGALVVEIQDRETFHLRQINATRDGSFIDLDKRYGPQGVSPAPPAAGLVMGDTHVLFVDPAVVRATFDAGGIVKTLRPKHLVWHDVLDFYSASHHHRGNPFVQVAKHRAGINSVQREIEETIAFIAKHTPPGVKNVIVPSNHNEHLDRWLRETDWRNDPANAQFYLETALELVRTAKLTAQQSEYLDPFHLWVRRLLSPKLLHRSVLLNRNQSHPIQGIEVGFHGDYGANGARGSILQYRRAGAKSVIGHSHSPGINEGCYQTGTSSFLELEYNSGLSGWLQTHCVIYANGKRSLINIINGSWRLTEKPHARAK